MAYTATIEEENKAIANEYKELIRSSYQTLSKEDKELIRKAFDLAVQAHSKQRRKSGEPYIFHPIAVAKIVANEIGLGATSIAAALLHDVVEDTEYTTEDMERLFGKTIAKIVDGLTKIGALKKDQDISVQAENFRKMLLTLHDDVRVIIIKIADRLHNMQTMDAMRPEKQAEKSSETLYIYAPLAHRLGLYNIKTELEDLGLKYTEPEVYKEIFDKITDSKEEQQAYIDSFSKVIEDSLNKEKLSYSIKGRSKSIFSIRRKMRAQDVTFEEVYDKFAIRIVYESKPDQEKFDAWKIYSIVTDHFPPNPKRLRDWISNPKSTGYEALHITVMGPQGKWVEVQIRSERMNEIAEKGYAAHYKYKNQNERENSLDTWLTKLQETLENQDLSAVDFVEDFKLNLYSKEIFVFTPTGDIKALPKGATAVDFAFAIHTQVGLQCRGARVNGKLRPLSHVLNSGDQVEIITSKNQKPSTSWLDFAVTARARSKIKGSLKDAEKAIASEGKEILRRKLRHLKIAYNEKTINDLVSHFQLKTSLDLFYRVGNGGIDSNQLKDFASQNSNSIFNFFRKSMKRAPIKSTTLDKEEITTKYDLLVFGKEEQRLDYSPAKCCNPIPGDKVFGFVTINDGIKVHKKDCPNAISMRAKFAYRIMTAKWIDSSKQEFKAVITISGVDNVGLVNELTKVISNTLHVNIHNLNIASNDGIFEGKLTISVKNKNQLKSLTDSIKKVDGIEKVTRSFKY